ncbi:MAG: type I restriction-modification system subunit M [Clostridia bacterium]|nr:type I restriction-modification system subunit M [Clostridia bacterium]
MSNNRNVRERDELHKVIWSIADDLRGSVDGWDFKQYILGIMFYRYISENITNYINDGERRNPGAEDFDYAQISDEMAESERESLVKEKGFFILPSELFCNVCKRAKSDENLNETLENIFNNIENSAKGAESEDDFAGLFADLDVNSNKLGATVAKRNDKLVKILDGIANINLGKYQDNSIDAFGDAYEFLMSMYASNAGKSGGEFYTPQEVSELLTRLAVLGKKSVNKVYDPACGSGSLLLKAAKILGKENVRNGFYGQEVNLTTYNLCRINMFLHDVGYDKFDIACEDTLVSPQHWDDEPFEVIVSNPPYSIKWAGDENPLLINDPRYSPAGVLAPKSKADFAFIMHSLSWLATNGTASIVCFPGILYRGGAEQKIRKYLVDNNFVDCIIQLPDNLFFGTSIATCIMVLKKSKKDNSVLFIDASKECVKVTNNNKLSDENIDNIVNVFDERTDKEYVTKLVSNKEIAENSYNLSVSTYVEKEDTREVIDINELNKKIDEIVAREQRLRDEINKIISEIEV